MLLTRPDGETLLEYWKAVNRSHAKIRALVEQAIATLTSWRLLRKPRCSTTRITELVQTVLTLIRPAQSEDGKAQRSARTSHGMPTRLT
jgi:hypothetical protein